MHYRRVFFETVAIEAVTAVITHFAITSDGEI